MEIFLIVTIVAALWFVLSGNYKTKLQDPQTLRPAEIEESIVELKKKILVTCAYKAEAEYQRLCYRLDALMGQILERHIHFVLDVEAMGLPSYGFFRPNQYHDASGMHTSYSLPYDVDPADFDPSLLIYACFFLWQGGQAKNIGTINSNSTLMLKILDYLIEEKNYGPAVFMKGMTRKYGLNVYSQCFPSEAKELLERAQQMGVGSAAIELEHIAKYSQLNGIKSVQLSERACVH